MLKYGQNWRRHHPSHYMILIQKLRKIRDKNVEYRRNSKQNYFDSRLFILLIIGDLLLTFDTLIVAAKYEKCVQFGCSLVEGTNDVKRFLAFLIEVSHPLDKPGQYCFLRRNVE